MFSGAITAMISPFRDGQVDEQRLRQNVEHQIAEGIDGLVPCGTTGESPTLSHAEHDRVIEVVVEAADKRVPVIAGTGSNSTAEALRLTRHAAQVGADASLQVNPYYNKPTQEGLYRHFMTIADEVDLKLVLYNIPGRTGVTMAPTTVVKLAKHPNIVAIKEATGSLDIASEIAASCDITILSGDDSLTLPLASVGGRGVISVLSNLLPKKVGQLARSAAEGDFKSAREAHLKLFPLFKGMFLETNPIPIKTAMSLAGLDTGELRLPLSEMDSVHRKTLEGLLVAQGVIEEVSA
ncbi:MAG: 4-hydroxy-tetrahydrodipicolinate synthase [Phycisphaeraceae bacterium]|nr:4-hydroxy-tetrahydrodipicolinate synthase [Phycisphaeraceae bacterium]